MQKELALYIEYLEFALNNTNQAEDRKLYTMYLASIGCVLAKVVLSAPREEIVEAIKSYDRLCGNTWLTAPVEGENSDSYNKFKVLIGYS